MTRLTRRAPALAAALALLLSAAAPAAPPPLADDLRFYPADADLVFAIHMDKLVASAPALKLRRELKDFDKALDGFRKEQGVAAADVERFGGGGRVKQGGVLLVRSAKPVKAADLLDAFKQPRFEGDRTEVAFKGVEVGKFTLYEPTPAHRQAFSVVGERALLLSGAKDVRAALERAGKQEKGAPSAGLLRALEQVDPTATAFIAADLKAMVADQPDAVPNGPVGGVNPRVALRATDALAGSVSLGDEVTFRLVAVCVNPKDATLLKGDADKALAALGMALKEQKGVPAEVAALPGMVKVSLDSNVVKAELKVKADVVADAIRMLFAPLGAPPAEKPGR